jgi:[ribosomal protein S18]-alanine N-acetyltransferase
MDREPTNAYEAPCELVSNAVQKPGPDGVSISWLLHQDLNSVVDIESRTSRSPWRDMKIRNTLCQPNNIALAARCGDFVAGYIFYALRRKALEIVRLAVAPEYSRQGVGTMLINRLKRKLSNERRCRLFVEVDECNLAAQLFFKSNHFLAIKRPYEKCRPSMDPPTYYMQFRIHPEVSEIE